MGVGDIYLPELRFIASDPDQQHVFLLNSFNDAQGFVDLLSFTTCDSKCGIIIISQQMYACLIRHDPAIWQFRPAITKHNSLQIGTVLIPRCKKQIITRNSRPLFRASRVYAFLSGCTCVIEQS